MSQQDEQEMRIKEILGGDDELDFDKAVEAFYDYLNQHLKLPCEVTGIEDFQWEEPYVFGPWDKGEYKQLKKTQPSYTDRYELLKIEQNIQSRWMMCGDEDIAAHVRRTSDSKKFILGLSELETTNKKSHNHQLIDDYSVWFVNSR